MTKCGHFGKKKKKNYNIITHARTLRIIYYLSLLSLLRVRRTCRCGMLAAYYCRT